MPPPFGAWLRQQRDRSGLSQAEVAALLDASVQSVMCWEKGRRFPRRDVEESYRRRIALAADEAVQIERTLARALDAIADERIRAAVARRFGVEMGDLAVSPSQRERGHQATGELVAK